MKTAPRTFTEEGMTEKIHKTIQEKSTAISSYTTPKEIINPAKSGPLQIVRAGELFMYCVWMQGVMIYLLVLSRSHELRKQFIACPTILSDAFVEQRTEWLRKSFRKILSEFRKDFDHLISTEETTQLCLLMEFRDMLAHCHISLGRNYILWGPRDSFENRIKAFGLKLDPEQKHQLLLLDCANDTVYLKCFSIIKQLDEGLMNRIAEQLGINYKTIR